MTSTMSFFGKPVWECYNHGMIHGQVVDVLRWISRMTIRHGCSGDGFFMRLLYSACCFLYKSFECIIG